MVGEQVAGSGVANQRLFPGGGDGEHGDSLGQILILSTGLKLKYMY